MISVIFCSKNQSRTHSTLNHYAHLLKDVPNELLCVDNPVSLAEGYNQAIEKSRGDILIFTHDDITFLDTESWYQRLIRHLDFQDIVGLAGTTLVVSAAWAHAGPPHTYGIIAEPDGHIAPIRVLVCSTPKPLNFGMKSLDGVFLAVRRHVVNRVRFDALNFDGFHCYDTDFCFRANLDGFKLAVAADLPALHLSQGNFDEKWKHYSNRFISLHSSHFPVQKFKPFQHSIVYVRTPAEALELMNGFQEHWRY